MKHFSVFFMSVILMLSITACSSMASNTDVSSSESQSVNADIHNPGTLVSDWRTALQYLKNGNERYVDNQMITRDTNNEDREILKDGQHPFAIIVTCSDSRVSPEIYFDQKLGDIFVIRNAGNVIEESALGSIEYAVEHLGAPLVVVVGHTSCGAVTGAVEGGEYPENLKTIIDRIQNDIDGADDLDKAIYANIASGVDSIKANEIVEEMGTTVLGACYDIETGEVVWLD